MANKYRDFDEFLKTQESEEQDLIIVKVYGEEYKISSKIPANIFLKLYRSSKHGVDIKESETSQLEVAMSILGEENVTSWCEKGMTIDALSEIVNWVTEQIMQANESEKDGKKQKTSQLTGL